MATSDEIEMDDLSQVSLFEGPRIDPLQREREFDQQYPHRPRNHAPTLPFHTLFQDLFQPLIDENEAKRSVPVANHRRLGPDHGIMSKQERKRAIIERYISRWRRDVGDDFFPAFRLIVPDKDRDRAMYGLKEKVLGRYLIKIMKIDRHSTDAAKILNWKMPVQGSQSGDFPGRCYEVISLRPSRVEVGSMTIQEVNEQLDALAAAVKEETQLPIMAGFYQRMNAEELKWLIRIILRDMKIGSTEKTFFHLWHPDAESLFNISSSLRRVCWELSNPNVRLQSEDRGVALMSCFQPQLANFQEKNFRRIVDRMHPTETDREFWIEEKMDGERMQMHMVKDEDAQGGYRFKFWSRKAKDYTYLYGSTLEDENGSLTRYLSDAFARDVENIIVDGEMITWDPEQDKQGVFGTLKSAALSEQKNPFAGKIRPLLRVFDILLLNGKQLTQYTLRDRRNALLRSVNPVHRRFEIQDYGIGSTAEDIEPYLRKVIEEGSEGLVIKNPRSAYTTGDRNNDWIKVKPEYMDGYGESLECLVVGGFFGSGRRGGGISSFLCGLRDDEAGSEQQPKFLSFFKVGGGIRAEDYDTFRHITDGKWQDYDRTNPPSDYLQLVGASKERPDVWIKPEDSFVIQVKASEITQSDEFAAGLTLRFPRFVKLRQDKDWRSTLSLEEFLDLKKSRELQQQEKKLEYDNERRKKRKVASRLKPLKVVGYGRKDDEEIKVDENIPSTSVFNGLTFFVMTESICPVRRTKLQLEQIIKANGGRITQTHVSNDIKIWCVADKRSVKVASLVKQGTMMLIKSIWIFDCIAQAQADRVNGFSETVLPWEVDRHLFYVPEDEVHNYENNVDAYGDAYFRDASLDDLRSLMSRMADVPKLSAKARKAFTGTIDSSRMPGWMFRGMRMYFAKSKHQGIAGIMTDTASHDVQMEAAETTAAFSGASTATDFQDNTVTHIIVSTGSNVRALRKRISSRKTIPRVVNVQWIKDSWEEKTLIDEDHYAA